MHDLRLAFRALRATPVVSIVAALSLALGVGANTAIFSIVNSLLLRVLPVAEPERLVIVLFGAGLSDLPMVPLPWVLQVAMWLLAAASLITCVQRLHTVRHSPGAADPMPPAGDDLEGIFRAMSEAGRLLRAEHPDTVLAETTIQGIVELGMSELCVRSVTRVQPGTHLEMQNEYRRLLKQLLDQQRDAGRAMLAA